MNTPSANKPPNCETCKLPRVQCICERLIVLSPREPSIDDGAAYEGKPRPEFVRRDDEGWRAI